MHMFETSLLQPAKDDVDASLTKTVNVCTRTGTMHHGTLYHIHALISMPNIAAVRVFLSKLPTSHLVDLGGLIKCHHWV